MYEAGYCGFWIQKSFQQLGIDCMITNAADVPTSDKERRHKNDNVDVGTLARERRNGTLKAIYVPERAALEDRTLVRMRGRFVRKQTRCKNQIKALLAFYGYRQHEDPDGAERYWSRAYMRWSDSIAMERASGIQSLKALLKELVFLRETIAERTKQIRRLAHEDHYRATIDRLRTIPGIGIVCAMTLMTELVTIERFRTLDHLASYTGLIPGEYSGGDTEKNTGITPRRNPAMRHMIIESAWIAKREDPALL